MYCNNCGEKIERKSAYCKSCGEKVGADKKNKSDRTALFKVNRKIMLICGLLLIIGVAGGAALRIKMMKRVLEYTYAKGLEHRHEYELDNNNQLVNYHEGDTWIIFDQYGEVNRVVKDGEDQYTKIIDTKGRIKEIVNGTRRTEYTYYDSGAYEVSSYENNKLDWLRGYDANGGLEKSYIEEKGILTIKNRYDELNRIINAQSYNEDGSKYLRVDYSYDQFGNLISTKFFEGDELLPCSDHTYEYDEANILLSWKDEYYRIHNTELTSYIEGTYQYDYNTNNQVIGYTFKRNNGEEYSLIYEYNQDGKVIKTISKSATDDKVNTTEYFDGVTFDSIKPTVDILYFADGLPGSLYGGLTPDLQYKPDAQDEWIIKSEREDHSDGSYSYKEYDVDGNIIFSEKYNAVDKEYDLIKYNSGDIRTCGLGETSIGSFNSVPKLYWDEEFESVHTYIDWDTGNDVVEKTTRSKPVIKNNITSYYKEHYKDNKIYRKEFVVIKNNGNKYEEYIFDSGKGLQSRLVDWLILLKIK